MLKPIKHVSEPDTVADKLRGSLIMTNKKTDTLHVEFGSPITPLQTQPSGLTSAATTTSNSSFSSSSSGHTPVSTKSDSGRSNPSAVQSSKPSIPSAAKSSKSTTSSAAPSRSSSSSAAHSGSSNPAKAGSNQKTASENPRSGRVSSASDSAPSTAKRSSKSSNPPPPQPVKILPGGNLFPSGKVHITGMTQGVPKRMVLGPGSKSYGYGSLMRGSSYSSTVAKPTTTSGSSSGAIVLSRCSSGGGSEVDTSWKRVMNSPNPEEVKRLGNEMFKKGCFGEALKFYDRALELSPSNATYRSNRAAALSGLGRVAEAVVECEHAIRLDPNFARAHHRLATLLLRLGQVDNAGKHFFYVEEPSDPMVVKVLEQVDRHLNKCADARRRGDWNIVLTEVSAAMESGADMSPQLAMCKVEALLKLLRLDEAQTILAVSPKIELLPSSFTQIRFFDMISEAYTYFVKSQMELALGRFENAVTFVEKASEMDPRNSEIETLNRNVRMIVRTRDRGNNLYGSERYTEASAAYAEGLKFDPYNATLFGHRADCFFKVGMWESSIEDCSHALLILPSYTKARRQRAASYSKLERWAEAVSDYEILRKELSYDREVAESLFHAQVALKKSRGEVVLNMEFGGEVEEIFSLEELKAALTRPGVSIVLFMKISDQQCKEISIFMDALCIRYPSLHFLKVEIEKCPAVGDAEKVRVVPTFKIYKVGIRMKEIVCPSKEALEISVRHYGL
ncbi:hypothetical protein N665_0083s0021 [Sinapis alba]|nr:hypothetical protein N665_0083s0021 [Sinapis alba]